jgi:hypothetical protein
MCLGCREMRAKKELIRLVRTADGTVEVDPTGKRAGRGAYVCRQASCLDLALQARRLEKALRHGVAAETVEKLRKEIEEFAGGI